MSHIFTQTQITGEDMLEAARQADCENFNSTERRIFREGFHAGMQHALSKPVVASDLIVMGLQPWQIEKLKRNYELATGKRAEDL